MSPISPLCWVSWRPLCAEFRYAGCRCGECRSAPNSTVGQRTFVHRTVFAVGHRTVVLLFIGQFVLLFIGQFVLLFLGQIVLLLWTNNTLYYCRQYEQKSWYWFCHTECRDLVHFAVFYCRYVRDCDAYLKALVNHWFKSPKVRLHKAKIALS